MPGLRNRQMSRPGGRASLDLENRGTRQGETQPEGGGGIAPAMGRPQMGGGMQQQMPQRNPQQQLLQQLANRGGGMQRPPMRPQMRKPMGPSRF